MVKRKADNHYWKLYNSGNTVLIGNEYRCSCGIRKIVSNPVLHMIRQTYIAIDNLVSKYNNNNVSVADIKRIDSLNKKLEEILNEYEPKYGKISDSLSIDISRKCKV